MSADFLDPTHPLPAAPATHCDCPCGCHHVVTVTHAQLDAHSGNHGRRSAVSLESRHVCVPCRTGHHLNRRSH